MNQLYAEWKQGFWADERFWAGRNKIGMRVCFGHLKAVESGLVAKMQHYLTRGPSDLHT
jgi:hypothetical protein